MRKNLIVVCSAALLAALVVGVGIYGFLSKPGGRFSGESLRVAPAEGVRKAGPSEPVPSLMTIGTGGMTGVYYPVGGFVARLLNNVRDLKGMRFVAESSGGSLHNLMALKRGTFDFAFVQSDLLYYAYHGENGFSKYGPDRKLRALFSLHSEVFTVVAARQTGIDSFDDLKGKRVNVGNPGSGQRQMMNLLMGLNGWSDDDFASVSELPAPGQAQALCENRVDAIVYMVGHPTNEIEGLINTCDARLVPVVGDVVEEMVERYDFYMSSVIPPGMYTGSDDEIKSLATGAVFVASADADEDLVYSMTRTVFEKLADLRNVHKALGSLEETEMSNRYISIPLHEGAVRYFREIGLLK